MSGPGYAATGTDLIDIDRYPLNDLDSETGRSLVERCQRSLQVKGAAKLDGFLRPDAIAQLIGEANALASQAFRNEDTHNVYFTEIDERLPATDARRKLQRSAQETIAYDQIPADAGIRRLYEWDGLLAFVCAALGKDRLYRNADPLGALNVIYYAEGDELGWHFDDAEFVVTLMLQPAQHGGDFEYVPHIRNARDENYPAVAQLLDGDRDDVIVSPSSAGALAFFRGHHSIHRVTPVFGNILRTNAVLSYANRPDERLSPHTQTLFYGRTG
ncbi:MAG TPA: hypothetical protein VFW09_08595 [Solirubrobacteraceae bacterium]|nr:hypothetical protein [Solirubrobacteraceae bacterium]